MRSRMDHRTGSTRRLWRYFIALAFAALAAASASAEPRGPGGGAAAAPAPTTPAAPSGGDEARARAGEPAGGQPEGPRPDAFDGRVEDTAAAFRAWLAGSPEAASYAGARDALAGLAERAASAGVPVGAIMLRVREAAAKRTDQGLLLAALEDDLARWTELAALLRGSGWPPAAQAPEFYAAAGAALRNGLDASTLGELMGWSARSKAAPERVGAAMLAASALAPALGRADAARCARALAASRLRPAEFDAAAGLLIAAAARGARAAELTAALEDVLGRRGTLRELERRLGRP